MASRQSKIERELHDQTRELRKQTQLMRREAQRSRLNDLADRSQASREGQSSPLDSGIYEMTEEDWDEFKRLSAIDAEAALKWYNKATGPSKAVVTVIHTWSVLLVIGGLLMLAVVPGADGLLFFAVALASEALFWLFNRKPKPKGK